MCEPGEHVNTQPAPQVGKWKPPRPRRSPVNRRGFFKLMSLRRSVRSFSEDDVPLSVIEDCVRVAACAPSGGHLQPWTFVVVQDAEVKRALRAALEEREQREHARQRVCGDAERGEALRAMCSTPLFAAPQSLPYRVFVKLDGPETAAHHAWSEASPSCPAEPAASAKYTSSGNPFSRPYVSEAPYVIVVMQHRWREAQPTRSPGHVDLPSNPRASWGSPTPTLAASSPIVAPGDHAQQAGAEPPGVSGAHGAGGMEAAVAVRPNGVLGPDEAALSTDEMAAKGRAGPRERVPVRNSTESCGIAVGMLVAALHNANLATVVTTPRGCDGAVSQGTAPAPGSRGGQLWLTTAS